MAVDPQALAQSLAIARNPQNYARWELTAREQTSIVTVAEMRDQLNLVGDTSQDDLITACSVAATTAIGNYIGAPLQQTTYRVYYNAPTYVNNYAYLDLPITTIDGAGAGGDLQFTVKYYPNGTTTEQTWTDWYYDYTGARLVLTAGLPALNQFIAYPVVATVTVLTSWYNTESVLKQAVKLMATHLYNNRSATAESVPREIALGIDSLLRTYKPLVM